VVLPVAEVGDEIFANLAGGIFAGIGVEAAWNLFDAYIRIFYHVYIREEKPPMAVTMTSIRLDTDLADEAVKVLKAKSRTDAVHIALREIVALKRFKKLMKKYEGKATFQGHID